MGNLIINNHKKSLELMNTHKNSILGSTDKMQPFIQDESMPGYDDESPKMDASEHGDKGGREHLKRRARAVKNSKYDSNFLVDYSGNNKKLIKSGDLDLKKQSSFYNQSGTSNGSKFECTDSINGQKNAKRQLKLNQKASEKEQNQYEAKNLMSQIQQIKIHPNDLRVGLQMRENERSVCLVNSSNMQDEKTFML
jgi:hypothetical protein